MTFPCWPGWSLFTCYHPCSPSPRENMPSLGPFRANTIKVLNTCHPFISINPIQLLALIISIKSTFSQTKVLLISFLSPSFPSNIFTRRCLNERGYIRNRSYQRPDNHIHISHSSGWHCRDILLWKIVACPVVIFSTFSHCHLVHTMMMMMMMMEMMMMLPCPHPQATLALWAFWGQVPPQWVFLHQWLVPERRNRDVSLLTMMKAEQVCKNQPSRECVQSQNGMWRKVGLLSCCFIRSSTFSDRFSCGLLTPTPLLGFSHSTGNKAVHRSTPLVIMLWMSWQVLQCACVAKRLLLCMILVWWQCWHLYLIFDNQKVHLDQSRLGKGCISM